MGKYGEPLSRHADVESYLVRHDGTWTDIRIRTIEQSDRVIECVNAMEGVERPAELMEKVRDLWSVRDGYNVEDIVNDILALLPEEDDGD